MDHIVCFSGGESSARVAWAVMNKFGRENTILLNHDISPDVEPSDVKRFKSEFANMLGIPITYANHDMFPNVDQFDVTIKSKAFKVKNGQELCTSRLKTEPFNKFLNQNYPDKNCIVYYGFDADETVRIQRRSSIMGSMGFKTDYPLALWNENIPSSHELGVAPPLVYDIFRHANCIGCLKAGKQHWYIVYCYRRDIFNRGKIAEEIIGHSILNGVYLEDLEPLFEQLFSMGITTTEHEDGRTFFARARKALENFDQSDFFQDFEPVKPCECVI